MSVVHIIIYSNYLGIVMSKKGCIKKIKENLGFIVLSIGVGIVITFVIPVWGWIIVVGGGLIYIGWYLIKNYK